MCTFISYHFIGCSAKYFWLLVRHGTRNPSDDDIVEMQTRGVEIQQNIIENHNQGKGMNDSYFNTSLFKVNSLVIKL